MMHIGTEDQDLERAYSRLLSGYCSTHRVGPSWRIVDVYYVAYKPITLSCILFMFIEMKFIHCHSCVMRIVTFKSWPLDLRWSFDLWVDDRVLIMTSKSLATGYLKRHTLDAT